MFCRNCGSEIPEGSMFCPECGQKVEEIEKAAEAVEEAAKQQIENFEAGDAASAPEVPPVPSAADLDSTVREGANQFAGETSYQPLYQPAYAAAGDAAAIPDAPKKSKKKLIWIIIGAVAAVGVILALLFIFVFGNNPTAVATEYAKASIPLNYEKVINLQYGMTYKEMLDVQAAVSGESKSDLEKELKDVVDRQKESLEESYGENAKITNIKVTKESEMTKDEIKEAIDAYNEGVDSRLEYYSDKLSSSQKKTLEKYRLKDNDVKAIYTMKVEYTIKGSTDSEDSSGTVKVANVKGKWYVWI